MTNDFVATGSIWHICFLLRCHSFILIYFWDLTTIMNWRSKLVLILYDFTFHLLYFVLIDLPRSLRHLLYILHINQRIIRRTIVAGQSLLALLINIRRRSVLHKRVGWWLLKRSANVQTFVFDTSWRSHLTFAETVRWWEYYTRTYRFANGVFIHGSMTVAPFSQFPFELYRRFIYFPTFCTFFLAIFKLWIIIRSQNGCWLGSAWFLISEAFQFWLGSLWLNVWKTCRSILLYYR